MIFRDFRLKVGNENFLEVNVKGKYLVINKKRNLYLIFI